MKIYATLLVYFVLAGVNPEEDEVVATVYNAVPSQCNEDPGHTAFMFELDLEDPYKHKIIAVSRDLLIKYPKGTRVRITGTHYDGIYTVMDKMNKRYKNRIDILINEDMDIGMWERVKILKL
jgi:3D (Asp-Asp-Asp) domain-containing protein